MRLFNPQLFNGGVFNTLEYIVSGVFNYLNFNSRVFNTGHEAPPDVPPEEEKKLGGKTVSGTRRWINYFEPQRIRIPETQELPKEIKQAPKVAQKRKRPKVDVTKYEMVEIPKVISEGWKPKAKYHEPIEANDKKFLENALPEKVDFDELARELATFAKEEAHKRQIREQNDFIMMMAMED